MTTTWKQLVQSATLTATSTSVYTSPTLTSTTFQAAAANNSTAASITVNLYLVPPGGTFSTAQRIASKAVAATSAIDIPELVNHKLEPGGQLYADGNGANLTVSGAQLV